MTPAIAHPIDLILADPMIRAVMKADHIDVAEMKTLLCSVRRRLIASPEAAIDDSDRPNAAQDATNRYGISAVASAGQLACGSNYAYSLCP